MEKIITIGLDLSLVKTGFTIVEEGGKVLSSGLIKSKPTGKKLVDETKRLMKIVDEVNSKINETVPDNVSALVVIEGLAFRAQSTALMQIAGLNYLTRALMVNLEYPFLIVAPTTLKKFITGSGKGEKDLMMMKVYKDYGFEALDNNESDAFSLSVLGLAFLDKPLKDLTEKQKDVIKLLKKQL